MAQAIGIISEASCVSFEWKIKNFFHLLQGSNYSYTSPDFTYFNSKWYLEISPCARFGGIYVTLNKISGSITHEFRIKISLKKCDQTECFSEVSCNSSCNWSNRKPLHLPSNSLRPIDMVAPGGVLTLYCTFYQKGKNTVDATCQTASSNCSRKLTENLKSLLISGQESDVTIKVENKEFKVHRAILGVRSPVFASMLTVDMVEKNTGVVEIPDCSAEGFEEFLLYLYTGRTGNLSDDNVCSLYQSADKYCVEELKTECVEFMKNCWTVENFCDIASLSLRYSEQQLIELAIQFFAQNVKEILKTVQWQLFVKENPVEANELYIKAIEILIPDKI